MPQRKRTRHCAGCGAVVRLRWGPFHNKDCAANHALTQWEGGGDDFHCPVCDTIGCQLTHDDEAA